MDDRDVTEIMVNGPNDIFYEKAGRIQRFKGHFSSEEKLEDVIPVSYTHLDVYKRQVSIYCRS